MSINNSVPEKFLIILFCIIAFFDPFNSWDYVPVPLFVEVIVGFLFLTLIIIYIIYKALLLFWSFFDSDIQRLVIETVWNLPQFYRRRTNASIRGWLRYWRVDSFEERIARRFFAEAEENPALYEDEEELGPIVDRFLIGSPGVNGTGVRRWRNRPRFHMVGLPKRLADELRSGQQMPSTFTMSELISLRRQLNAEAKDVAKYPGLSVSDRVKAVNLALALLMTPTQSELLFMKLAASEYSVERRQELASLEAKLMRA